MTNNSRDTNLKQAGRTAIAIFILAVVVLAGCQGQSILDKVFPEQKDGLVVPQSSAKNVKPITEIPIPTPTTRTYQNLTVWIPPQFDIEGESKAASLLKSRLQEFSKINTQVNLDVRVKSDSGPGSILETLNSASKVAPDALPSLVLISRSDLVQAASLNLLSPMEGYSGVINKKDWFDISKEMGSYQGTIYCFPFAVNAIGLVYKNIKFNNNQPSWDEVIRQSDNLFFAAGDPEALTTITLYESAGGGLFDEAERPALEVNVLTTVLSGYATASRFHRLPKTTLDYQTDDQVWDAFLSSNKGAVLTWTEHALTDLNSLNLALLPSFGSEPFTLAGGWVLCLTEPHEQDKIYSIELAEFLVEPEFQMSWSPVSGYLPIRPSSIPGYEGIEMQNTITKIMQSAHLRPERIQTSVIGQEIKIAVSEVLQRLNTPELSAINAIKRLEAMRTQ
jgi:multiple sugar transport system substrate-binding protein